MEQEILRVGVRKCGVSGFKSVGRESARGERMGISDVVGNERQSGSENVGGGDSEWGKIKCASEWVK